MEFLHPEVEKEYLRWMAIIGTNDPYVTQGTVGLHDVMRAHFLIVDFFVEKAYGIGGVGPKSIDLLHSSIYRQFVSFGGKDKWPSMYEKCATLLFGLVKDHPFHDANKRTAFLVTLYQLDRLNRTPRVPQREFEDFIVEVADNRLARYARYRDLAKEEEDAEIHFIADFLKRNTREIDRRIYTITYHELNQILKKYGFELINPNKNFIDVVRVEHKPRFLGIIGPLVRKEYRLTQIGFPGWKKQVGKGTLKATREATELTVQRGYDSKTFFQGADPLHTLIDVYSEPLRRLADR
jgi:death-on-curing protein